MTTAPPSRTSSIVPPMPAAAPTFPMTPNQRASYQALLELYQSEMDTSADPVVLTAINPSLLDVADLLTKDNMYKLHATTALLQAVKEQFETTNDGLKKLAVQIAATQAHFTEAATILTAINTVFPYLAAL